MKHLLLSVSVMLAAMSGTAQTMEPSWRWGVVADGTTSAGDNCTANAVSDSGNALWLGTFNTTAAATEVKFGADLLFSTQGTPAAGVTATNMCLIQTSPDGALNWELHTLGADCTSGNGGVVALPDGGCAFAVTLRHADLSAMPAISVVDGKGVTHQLPWSTSQKFYSILVGRTDNAGAVKWLRLYHPDTTPGPAAAGSTADFWPACVNLGNLAVDDNDNLYMVMNLRNALNVPGPDGENVRISVQNIKEWTGDAQVAAGDFLLLSLDGNGYYRKHLGLDGSCAVAYGQRVVVSGGRVYAQGYITGNGNTLTAGSQVLAPSAVMSPLVMCTDTQLAVDWAQCFPAETVAGKYALQNTALNISGNTLWLTGMFNLAFGVAGSSESRVASTQGAVREGLILKLDARNGSWIKGCTSRSGNFNIPSAVANTGLTGYMNVVQPSPDSENIYVFGYVMNSTVGVFLREYNATSLQPNLASGQHNIINGGGVPSALCSAYSGTNGAIYVAARGNKAFVPAGGTESAAPSGWGVYMARFDIFKDIESSVISPDYENNTAPVEYFNLQGVRVENPSHGIYVRRQGNQVSKVVL